MIDFNKFGKSQQANQAISPSVNTPVSVTAPIKKTGIDFNKFGKSGSAAPTVETPPENNGFIHNLISAPATMIARPIQAIAELAGASAENVDKFSREKLGGLVAPVPRTFKDVKKDIGRGIGTVALGLEAPLAAGASLGFGNSLEQGNRVFSGETLKQTLLGLGAGKALDLVGKPLLNAAGKVIGTITPKILQDVVSKGASSLSNFMAQHELLNNVAKPLSEKISTSTKNFDTKINNVLGKSKGALGNIISNQYPSLSKESRINKAVVSEKSDFAKPTTLPEAGYSKATDVFNNAKKQGTDLSQVAVDNKITHRSIVDGGKYNTEDTVGAIRKDAMQTSHDLMRPALQAAEGGVQRVPVSELRQEMINDVNKIPSSQIEDSERETILKRINSEYADDSAAALAHPNGYSLTDLHDAKIATGNNAKYKFNSSTGDSLIAKQKGYESDAFRKALESKAPAELNIKEFNKNIQKKFQLADYLESLHGKKVPQSLLKKIGSSVGRIAGAGVGSGMGGGLLGGVGGYHLGGVLTDAFENMSNPLKAAALRELKLVKPEIFKAFEDFYGKKQIESLTSLKLPPGNKMKANYPVIELGPRGTKKSNVLLNDYIQNKQILQNTKQLSGPLKRLIVPNTQGTPNITSGTYSPGGDREQVGGLRQRLSL